MDYLGDDEQEQSSENYRMLVKAGASEKVAHLIALSEHCASLLNAVWSLKDTTGRIDRYMSVYYWIGKNWHIDWLRRQIEAIPLDSIWTQVGRSAAASDIDSCQRVLVRHVFTLLKPYKNADIESRIHEVGKRYHKQFTDWQQTIEQMQSLTQSNFAVFTVCIRRLECLSDAMRDDLEVTQS